MHLKIILFILLSLLSSLTVADELIDLSVEQVQAMQNDGEALMIDIRTEQEWQSTGIIPSSHKLEFFNKQGKYDAEQWLNELTKLQSSPDQPVILVCRSGNRSGMVGQYLTQQLGMKNVYHLSNGIQAWIKKGKKLDNVCLNQIACN